MSKVIPTLSKIVREIHRMDPSLKDTDEAFRVAVALVSAAAVTGPDVRKLVKFTGYSAAEVRKWSANWRASKVFRRGRVVGGEWLDKKTGGVAFWLDVNVGLGLMRRVHG